MNILCIDTSFFTGAVGIMRNNDVIMSISFNVQATYSEKLLYMIDLVCKETGVELKCIDLIAVARGPGSFTGLRIGMTAAKTIAYVYSIPIAGVDTLATAVFTSKIPKKWYIPIHDARKNQVYAAVYHTKDNTLIEEYESGSYDIHACVSVFRHYGTDETRIFVSDGSLVAQSVCDAFPDSNHIVIPFLPDIYALGVIAKSQCENNTLIDVRSLEPLYGRLSDAEIQYEKRKNSQS